MSLDAMKQALAALEEINQLSIGENAICLPAEIDTTMDALRAAIEQTNDWDEVEALRASLREHMAEIHRLRQWQGLTDEERGITAAETWGSVLIAPQSYQAFARAIEAKLRERNT